ncbi:hypothetical protein [Metabacillus schmidteae]|uniref:hypothetical protein n=1 Tax=Metabacillus schmidteae TaxID=2730405 RepID=UPI00158E6E90|nr:hypothetical protein [Metabacillus schmidteae]
MFGLILLCFVIYSAAYLCMKSSGQSLKVKPIHDFDDYFVEANGRMKSEENCQNE